MARTDAMVLGAGIVGTSVALHLARRGLSVALVDRAGVGEQTSYGNAGVIEGNTIFPPAFPSDIGRLLRVALKRATEANYHLTFLPRIMPWLLAFRAASQPDRLAETAHLIRPLFSRAVAEHEVLMAEAGAMHYLRKTGWLKVYRDKKEFQRIVARIRSRDEIWFATPGARLGWRAGAGAVTPSGVRPRSVLAASSEREQSAWRDPCLCCAFHSAGRCHSLRRCAVATSEWQSLASRDQRRRARCDAMRDCARAMDAGSAQNSRPDVAARGQARLPPPFSCAGECRPVTASAGC